MWATIIGLLDVSDGDATSPWWRLGENLTTFSWVALPLLVGYLVLRRLRQANERLTARVGDRTAELGRANAALEARARQMNDMALAALAVNSASTLEEVMQVITDRARHVIGAHQAVTSFTREMNWTQAITGLSLSEKYASYRSYDAKPDGSGIYALVCETNHPMRLTQAELEAHPRWRGFGTEARNHPAMRGWMAAPLISRDGKNLGLIQLSDKCEGEFTAEDEILLVQLAQMGSVALEIRRFQQDLEARVEERTAEVRFLGDVIGQSTQPFGAIDFQGRIIRFNRAFEQLTGYDAEELRQMTYLQLTPERWHAFEQQRVSELIATGNPQHYEKEYRRKDGRLVPLELMVDLFRDAAGKPRFAYAFVTDVSERKEVEQTMRQAAWELAQANAGLEQAQQALAEIAAQLAMPASDAHTEGRTFRLSGFTLTDMMTCGSIIRGLRARCTTREEFSQSLVGFLHDHLVDDHDQPAVSLVRMFETRSFGELDDGLRAAATSLWPAATRETLCLTLQATAGLRPEWNHPDQSKDHRAIPLPSPEAVERLPMISQLIRQLGFEVEGVLRPDEHLLIPRGRTGVFHVAEARGSPCIPAQETFVVPHGIRSVIGFGDINPDGRLFAVILFSRVPITREVAVLFGYLSLSTRIGLLSYLDIPHRTESQIVSLDRLLRAHEEIVAEQEEELHQTLDALTRSNRELEQFAYIASHDLQEPLRKVQAFGDMLVNEYRDVLGDEGRDYLRRMQNASQRMQALINDLLSFARVTTKARPFVPVDLAEVARQVVSDLEARLRDTSGQVLIGSLPVLVGDPMQMRQLLQNLIGNALKFHRVGVQPLVKLVARDHVGDEGPRVEIAVEDNGIGFEEKYLDRIFTPFQRLHGRGEYEGTGMGLAICRKIVERHGGTISARSTPGVGSAFVVVLPLEQPGGDP